MHSESLKFSGHDVPELAILITRTRDGGTHTGILCRYQGQLHVIHQAWHEMLKIAPDSGNFPCVIPNLLPEEMNDVTANCRLLILRRMQGKPRQRLPYGFSQPQTPRIDADGEVILGGGAGLTCSTFVLAVFEAAKVPWIDLSDWSRREEDDARHEQLLLKMRMGIPEFGIPPAQSEHIRKVEKELPCIRVRPEEAAAPGLADRLPIGFEQAERFGHWILERLAEHSKRSTA